MSVQEGKRQDFNVEGRCLLKITSLCGLQAEDRSQAVKNEPNFLPLYIIKKRDCNWLSTILLPRMPMVAGHQMNMTSVPCFITLECIAII